MPTCPVCGQDNPAIARYCLACGTPLEGESGRREERKVVTALFCDLVGFTSRSEVSDPEEVRAMLRAYYFRVRELIEHFGGTVEKFIGDAVVAVFGAPVAHEDDPERALHAAFRVLGAIAVLRDEWPGFDLAVRIGVNTGETLVTPAAAEAGEGLATGDVMNTAARLQALAPTGGILVGESTHSATLHLVDYEALPPADLRGKAEPVAVWRAVALRSRVGSAGEDVHAGPMVGRKEEQRAIIDEFLRMADQRSVRLLTLVGEAGVGKSRLITEFFHFVDQRPELTYWRQTRCLPYGDSFTFWPLAQIVKSHAGILESDGPEVWREKLDAAAQALPIPGADRDWIRARLGSLMGADLQGRAEPTEQAESFTAWRRFLEAVASVHPLILVVEDVQWADDPMLDFLEHLVVGPGGYPMLVLCTARQRLLDRRPGWGGQWANSLVIRLGPLSDADTRTLLGASIGQETVDQETVSAVLERAGGNPLFAQEFARLIRDRASRPAPSTETPVPRSITSIIAARLDTLPPRVKSVLQDASVIGKVFWSGALAAMGGMDESEVLGALRELMRRELVSRSRASRMSRSEEVAFSHGLVRDVAYSQIPRTARAAKHRAVAEWLDVAAGDPSDVAELLVYHYQQALDLSPTLEATTDGLQDRFRKALLVAADRAASLDVASAADYYLRALQALAETDPRRPRALIGFADVAAQAGRFSEAEAAYEEAIAAFRTTGDHLSRGDAGRKLSNLLWHQGEVVRSQTVLDEAVALLELEPPGRELAEACSEAGWANALGGDLEAAVSWSGRALDIAAAQGLEELRPRALSLRGQARCHLGDRAGIEEIRSGLNLAMELGLSREAARAEAILAEELIATVGPEEGARVSRIGINLAEGRGVTSMAMALRALTLVPSLMMLGEWADAMAEADSVVSWSSEAGGNYFGTLARAHSAHIQLWQGVPIDPAREEEFLPVARDIGDPQVLVPSLAVAAILRSTAGLTEAAQQIVLELVSFQRDPGGWIRATYLADIGRICRDATPDLAEAFLAQVTGATRLTRLGRLTVRAVLDEAAGRAEQAAAKYAKAAEGWGAFGARPLEARCLLDEGRCLLRVGGSEG